MHHLNLKSFVLGIIVTIISIASVKLALSKLNTRPFHMVVSDKEMPCINNMLTIYGELITQHSVSYPEYLTGTNLLEVKLNDPAHEANFVFGACFQNGYIDSHIGDPYLWDTLREFGDKRGNDVFITNKYGSDKLRVYFIDK